MNGRLKLSSKRLTSGRFQVNFVTEGPNGFYGYMLAESQTSVREVILKIEEHMRGVQNSDRYFQPSLFSMGRKSPKNEPIMIFKSKAA
jgi:hypothetical protein